MGEMDGGARFGLVGFGLVWFGSSLVTVTWCGLVRYDSVGMVWFGLILFGLMGFGLVWFELAW